MNPVSAYARANAAEITAVVATLDEEPLEALVDAIVAAPRVYLTGVGRSGLAGRAIAMRLMHIGLSAYAVGEVATPGIGRDDLLIAITATGRGAVVDQARTALRHGATVAAITTRAEGDLQDLAGPVVRLPVRDTVPTEQHAGSLFEQSALVVGDAVCRRVQEVLGVPTAELDRRHANLA